MRFSPTGEDFRYFSNHSHRINSAGLRTEGKFPSNIEGSNIDFSSINLRGADLRGAINLTNEQLESAKT